MQFDGNWTAVEGVVVDKLGKYAYAIPGLGGAPATPFILDVALDVRAKVYPPLSRSTTAGISGTLTLLVTLGRVHPPVKMKGLQPVACTVRFPYSAGECNDILQVSESAPLTCRC